QSARSPCVRAASSARAAAPWACGPAPGAAARLAAHGRRRCARVAAPGERRTHPRVRLATAHAREVRRGRRTDPARVALVEVRPQAVEARRKERNRRAARLSEGLVPGDLPRACRRLARAWRQHLSRPRGGPHPTRRRRAHSRLRRPGGVPQAAGSASAVSANEARADVVILTTSTTIAARLVEWPSSFRE